MGFLKFKWVFKRNVIKANLLKWTKKVKNTHIYYDHSYAGFTQFFKIKCA